jgi:hypothetical protein
MNIDAEINNYLSRLSEDEKLLLLNFIKNIGGFNEKASIAERIISYNNELEEAVQRIKSGDFVEHTDVLNESDEW